MKKNIFYLTLIITVVVFHLIEVQFIDPWATNIVNFDYANIIQNLENGFVKNFSNYRVFGVTHFFVFIYIVVYPFTLWFTPLYLLLKNDKKTMKNLSWGLLLIYIFALPFYLFLPINNVYTFYNIDSALEAIIPGIEHFFYTTTTYNNCLPSLHTAVSILIAYTGGLTGNKRYGLFTKLCMILVITAVIYLSIHWLLDVIAGGLLAVAVILILKKYFNKKTLV